MGVHQFFQESFRTGPRLLTHPRRNFTPDPDERVEGADGSQWIALDAVPRRNPLIE
jgi:hypothetical protein